MTAVRVCRHLSQNSPHPWNWVECGRPADPSSPPERPRCEQHLIAEEKKEGER